MKRTRSADMCCTPTAITLLLLLLVVLPAISSGASGLLPCEPEPLQGLRGGDDQEAEGGTGGKPAQKGAKRGAQIKLTKHVYMLIHVVCDVVRQFVVIIQQMLLQRWSCLLQNLLCFGDLPSSNICYCLLLQLFLGVAILCSFRALLEVKARICCNSSDGCCCCGCRPCRHLLSARS
jgi:hypothetical protein